MKKISTSIFFAALMSLCFSSKAAVFIVDVEDFEFDPAILNVNVGDTVMWMWDEGSHTTTSGLIPAGAAPWDQPINQSSPMCMYVPTVAGSYDYFCTPHASMGMQGHFTVTSVTSINDLSLNFVNIRNNPFTKEVVVTYDLPVQGKVLLNIYNILGNVIQKSDFSVRPAGKYEHVISTADLPKGIYIIEIVAAGSKASEKILLQ